MSGTVLDFWRMVWEHRPATIVMLTKQIEGGKVGPSLSLFLCTEDYGSKSEESCSMVHYTHSMYQ